MMSSEDLLVGINEGTDCGTMNIDLLSENIETRRIDLSGNSDKQHPNLMQIKHTRSKVDRYFTWLTKYNSNLFQAAHTPQLFTLK